MTDKTIYGEDAEIIKILKIISGVASDASKLFDADTHARQTLEALSYMAEAQIKAIVEYRR